MVLPEPVDGARSRSRGTFAGLLRGRRLTPCQTESGMDRPSLHRDLWVLAAGAMAVDLPLVGGHGCPTPALAYNLTNPNISADRYRRPAPLQEVESAAGEWHPLSEPPSSVAAEYRYACRANPLSLRVLHCGHVMHARTRFDGDQTLSHQTAMYRNACATPAAPAAL